LYNEFISYLDRKQKADCVRFAVSHLSDGTLDVVTFYNDILTPSLYAEICTVTNSRICIWEEHVRTSIVRTVVENCYPYVIKERDEKYRYPHGGKTIITCPPEELHEIGARMVADFFTLCGFETTFVGANTPQEDIVSAIEYFEPDYVGVSVTNVYNLVATRKLLSGILEIKKKRSFTLILGGQACYSNQATCLKMEPDMIINSFEDIRKLAGGETNAGP